MKKSISSTFLSAPFCFVMLLIGVISSKSFAQTDSVIIDPTLSTNYVVDIDDTLFSANPDGTCVHDDYYYELDIDHNDSIDFRFEANCYWGGLGNTAHIKLSSSDNSRFATEMVIDSVGHLDQTTGAVIFEPEGVEIVKIYDLNDNVYTDSCISSEYSIVTNYLKDMTHQFIMNSVDNWISGEHYIGIKKIIDGTEYLGWIKILAPSYYKIIIEEYALNTPLILPEENVSGVSSVFPNPSSGMVNFNFETQELIHLQVIKMNGESVFEADLTEMENSFDFTSFQNGIYIIHLTAAAWTAQHLFVKE